MKKSTNNPRMTSTGDATGNQQPRKKGTGKIILWILTVFMFLSALVFFPSVASIIMLVFCAFAIPIPKVQEFWRGLGLNKILKTALLCVLFIVSVLAAPTDNINQDNGSNVTDQQITDQQNGTLPGVAIDEPPKNDTPMQQPEPTQDVENEPEGPATEPAGETDQEPEAPPVEEVEEPETQPEVTEDPEPVEQPQTTSRTVYVTATGSKYHYDNNCGNGTYYKSTLDAAKNRGLEPCAKCVGG